MTCQLLPLGGFVQFSLWNRTWSWSCTFQHYFCCINCHISQHSSNSPAQVLLFFHCSNVSPSLIWELKTKFVSPTLPTLSTVRDFLMEGESVIWIREVWAIQRNSEELPVGSCSGTAAVQAGNGAEWAGGKGKGRLGQMLGSTRWVVTPSGYTVWLEQCPGKKLQMEDSLWERKLSQERRKIPTPDNIGHCQSLPGKATDKGAVTQLQIKPERLHRPHTPSPLSATALLVSPHCTL